jgi:hypothetical protein
VTWHQLKDGAWSGRNYWTASPDVKARVDPYMVWADATNFADLAGGEDAVKWVPVIIELKQGTVKKFAELLLSEPWIRVSSLYRSPCEGLEDTTFCTAVVAAEFFAQLGNAPLQDYIERFEIGYPVITPSEPGDEAEVSASSGGPVVIGIIDDGLAFAHRRFRKRDGSARVEFFWTQDGSSAGVPGPGYGKEFSKSQIDVWLEKASPGGMLDEDRVYQIAEYRGVTQRAAHGTHIMDLACGEDPQELDLNTPRIVCVQLPKRPNRGGTPLAVHLLDGVRYIIDRADRIARANNDGKPAPVVVNLSYGNIAGPHDGSSTLEKAIDQLITMRQKACPFSVVIPSGNSHLSRCHATFTAPKAGFDLKWRIMPDCRTPSFLEIWLPKDAGNKAVSVEVTLPTGETIGGVAEGHACKWQPGTDVLCTAVYLNRVANGDGNMILIAVAPTSWTGQNRDVAPSGIWNIRVRSTSEKPLSGINAWIQRNDRVFGGLPYGRQSRFEDPLYVRLDRAGREITEDDKDAAGQVINDNRKKSYIRREGTINAIATGERTIVIGAYRRSDGAAAPYSAAGFTNRQGADAMLSGDDTPIYKGIRAAGTRSGSSVVVEGTSVAAPQMTRWIAERLAAGNIDRAIVQAEARKQESDPASRPSGKPYRAEKPPAYVGGKGRIELPPRSKRERR